MLNEVLFNSQDTFPQYTIECLYDAVYLIRPVLYKRSRTDIAVLKEMLERKELIQIKWIDKSCHLADSLTKREASSTFAKPYEGVCLRKITELKILVLMVHIHV